MQIGTLATQTGVTRDALRFYEERGLIRSTRSSNTYRTYAPETVQLVGYIRTAQSLGFTLSEIGENLPALWSSTTPAATVAQLLSEKVNMIDRKIADLTALKQALLDRVAQTCPLLAATRTKTT